MVVLSLSQLKVLEEIMEADFMGVEVDVIVDCNDHEVVLEWSGSTAKGLYKLRHAVGFHQIAYGHVDVLGEEARRGVDNFLTGVAAHEVSSS